jgi:hypothetical protein
MNNSNNIPKLEIVDQYLNQYEDKDLNIYEDVDEDEDQEQKNLKLSIESLSKQLIQLQSSNNSSYNNSPDHFTSKITNNPYQQFEKAKIQTAFNQQLFGQALQQARSPQALQQARLSQAFMQHPKSPQALQQARLSQAFMQHPRSPQAFMQHPRSPQTFLQHPRSPEAFMQQAFMQQAFMQQTTTPQAKIKQTNVSQIIQETNKQIYMMQKSIDSLEIKYTDVQKELIEQKKIINSLVSLVKELKKEAEFKNDECIANVLFNEEKLQVKQSNEDLRISYFNIPFKKNKETNENNIKLCVQDIESGMNKSYKKEYKFVLIKTNCENVFIIAKNDNNKNIFNIDINEYFSSIDIKHIEEDIFYRIKDALPSIIPKLFFERPLGMKMTVCYIDNCTKFHSNYSFVRLFVSNQEIKCDYRI